MKHLKKLYKGNIINLTQQILFFFRVLCAYFSVEAWNHLLQIKLANTHAFYLSVEILSFFRSSFAGFSGLKKSLMHK